MNDCMEMHWGYQAWVRSANRCLEELGTEFIDSIDAIVSSSTTGALPLAACFSLSGDMLSQWRGYADNGAGFCIAFRSEQLCDLPARPLRVLYESQAQELEICRLLSTLKKVRDGDPENDEDFFRVCAEFSSDLAALKNPSFVEEQEVRLMHLVNFAESNDFLKLVDAGGTAFGHCYEPQQIRFTMRGSTPVPYIDLPFVAPDGQHPIAEVILGPRNDALPTAVSVFLETNGLGGVSVQRSGSSYR